ncbi:MAG: hypothetical protein E2O55_06405 [Gammaproteobacteria bacterium]|nr:MAG: hypothetical protein E2O55_06405 [Gammaproteobacteria bacterium]
MNLGKFLLVIVAGGAAATSLACEYPALITVPDGQTSTMEELIIAQAAVREYMAGMEAYLACVNEEMNAAGDDAPVEYKSIMFSRHNAAVAEMEAIASSFNEQVQTYKEANPGN